MKKAMQKEKDINDIQFQTELNELISKGDWASAIRLVKRKLKLEPYSHWLYTRLSSLYYEKREYEIALKYAILAHEIKPNCPLVLWDYAGALYMVGAYKEAITRWKKIISQGVDNIANGECGEGLQWARSIINDSHYKIANALINLNKYHKAKQHLVIYFDGRKKKSKSIFSLKQAQEKMEIINNSVINDH